MSGSRGVRLPFPSTERNLSGQRPKVEREARFEDRRASHFEEAAEPAASTDPLLEHAEREGQLLARLADQEREIAQLKRRLEQAETALGAYLAELAMTAIHESPTNPPPNNTPTTPPPASDEEIPRRR